MCSFNPYSQIPDDAKKIILEFYDAQDSDALGEDDLNLTERSDFDDEDKVMHTFIGRTELNIDKIL